MPRKYKVVGGMYRVSSEVIGRGAFSTLHDVECVDENPDVCPMVAKVVANGATETLDNEIRCWKLVQGHPNIVNLTCVVKTESRTFIIQEKVDGEELFDVVLSAWEAKGSQTEALSEGLCARYFSQLCLAVMHCHGSGVAHRDIKPENILIDAKTNSVKLIDFGLATTHRMTASRAGTLHYLSPEALTSHGMFDSHIADVWACGVVLFVMLTGQHPFSAETDRETWRSIASGQFRVPSTVSDCARDLTQKLLAAEPIHRISLEDALRHPFVTGQPDGTVPTVMC